MSEADAAQEVELREWERINAAVANKPEPAYGPANCVECDNDMHPVRRQHGFKLCVECQTLREAAQR